MAEYLTSGQGDVTTKDTVPDWNSGRAWAWEKMTKEARAAGTLDKLPHSPRKGLAEQSFWSHVDAHMSRTYFTMPVSFKDGRIVRE